MKYITLIPEIINLVKALETLMPDSPGKAKFEALVKTIEGVYGTTVNDVPSLEKFVSAVVAIAKAVGVFKVKVA